MVKLSKVRRVKGPLNYSLIEIYFSNQHILHSFLNQNVGAISAQTKSIVWNKPTINGASIFDRVRYHTFQFLLQCKEETSQLPFEHGLFPF